MQNKRITFDKALDANTKAQLSSKTALKKKVDSNVAIGSASKSVPIPTKSVSNENEGSKDTQVNKSADYNALGGYASLYGFGGMYGMGGMYPPNSPLYFIQNINYSIMALGQMAEVLRMSTTALGLTIIQLLKSYKELLIVLRHHKYFVWLQGKCKKSKVLRFTVVTLSMYFTSKIVSLIQAYISQSCAQQPCSTTQGIRGLLDSLGLFPSSSGYAGGMHSARNPN